jgi:predicted transcriptional regulator
MPKDAVFTMKLDAELREKFMAEAEALDRPASQVVRELMREFVHKKEEEREYDTWFRQEVEEALREADDPNAVWYTTEEVMERMLATINEAASRREPENEG